MGLLSMVVPMISYTCRGQFAMPGPMPCTQVADDALTG